ncbi:MAG: aldehyde dehydrogenase family protein, partial [Thaumarchaeota archaeon]|nr:aldehyde dehydrogenase family protein [Nitrososphaerota archaeon]
VDYGLAASIYGRDILSCVKVANKLNFGTVWINEHGILVSEMPHGGFKQSGFGKDLSMYSFEEYTRVKHIYVDLTGRPVRPWHYTVFHGN